MDNLNLKKIKREIEESKRELCFLRLPIDADNIKIDIDLDFNNVDIFIYINKFDSIRLGNLTKDSIESICKNNIFKSYNTVKINYIIIS